jgi:hypothetical protein
VIFMRSSRSFSEIVKIANFSFNKGEGEGEGENKGESEGSDWICVNAWLISVMACSNSEASFSDRYVFAFSNICTPLFICLIRSVCEVNLSVYFNENVFFRFFELAASLIFILSVN